MLVTPGTGGRRGRGRRARNLLSLIGGRRARNLLSLVGGRRARNLLFLVGRRVRNLLSLVGRRGTPQATSTRTPGPSGPPPPIARAQDLLSSQGFTVKPGMYCQAGDLLSSRGSGFTRPTLTYPEALRPPAKGDPFHCKKVL